MTNIKTITPLHCHLFKKDVTEFEATTTQMDSIKEYPERQQLDAHECRRALLRCKACEQLYFYEFLEWIDWEDGNDPQYRKFIPVADERSADALNDLSALEITGIRPQLCVDWPADGDKQAYWLV